MDGPTPGPFLTEVIMGDVIEFPLRDRMTPEEDAYIQALLDLDEHYCFLFKAISEAYTGDDLSQNIFLEQLIECCLLSFYSCGVDPQDTYAFQAFQEYFPQIQIEIETDDG